MKFELDEIEKENAVQFLDKIKKKYGSYGYITYSFTETGIGCCVRIKRSNSKKEKAITNIERW